MQKNFSVHFICFFLYKCVWGYFFQYWPLSLFFLIGGLKRRETNEKSSSKNREKKGKNGFNESRGGALENMAF